MTASLVERRIGLLFAGFLALLSIAFLRAAYLGTAEGGKLTHAADVQAIQTAPVPARRGTIVDRRGVELAVSEPADDVSIDPYLVKDPVRTANKLAPLLHRSPESLLQKVTAPHRGFVFLGRRVPGERADRIAHLGLPGITLTPNEIRTYPHGMMAAQVLGMVGIDGKGLSGLEYRDDRALHGIPGERRTVRDAIGQTVSVDDLKPATAGARVQLTLDSAIQDRAETVLQQVGAQYRPKSATAIVMDPRDGNLLALANWPRIDANHPGQAPAYALQDRAVGFDYEPGSTFKAITIAGALSEKLVTPDTKFFLPSQIQVADRTIHNAEDRPAETMSVSDILARSDNVGAITIGEKLGKVNFDKWARKFGFGSHTGVDLPGEEQGQLLTVGQYSGSSMGNLPIGQGELVTPLQIATAYSAIANGGILRPPHIVRRLDGRLQHVPRGKRILTGPVAAQLRGMLKGVLAPGGTASEVSIPGYKLAGKTGTASKIDPATGQYSSSKYVASFVGFAPADHPRLLVAVVVDEPQGAIYGGTVAAPAFGKIASFALPYLQIPPG